MSEVRYGRLTEGSSVEWYTPPELFEAVGINFDLDVCAPTGGLPWIPATWSFCQDDDGLAQPWHGKVWMNPPYGKGIDKWMQKLAEHGDGIAFVHARTGTVWWREAVAAATAVCFVADSVRFVRGSTWTQEPGGSPVPLVLIAYGLECATALMQSGLGPCFIVPPGTKPGKSLAQQARS